MSSIRPQDKKNIANEFYILKIKNNDQQITLCVVTNSQIQY